VSNEQKRRVAREAATLLYFGAEKEYKQAKQHAAETLGTHFLPSNLEVALELDRVAEENEGDGRTVRLVEMRIEALEIMRLLAGLCPVLIGSVWRGTIKRGSDIDIAVYDDSEQVLPALKDGGVKIEKTESRKVNKQGATLESYHIHAKTSSGYSLEVTVRSTEEADKRRRCETFGDEIRGLTVSQLEMVLKMHPTQQFIPQ
jgi:predicted nucleotidyltransferase